MVPSETFAILPFLLWAQLPLIWQFPWLRLFLLSPRVTPTYHYVMLFQNHYYFEKERFQVSLSLSFFLKYSSYFYFMVTVPILGSSFPLLLLLLSLQPSVSTAPMGVQYIFINHRVRIMCWGEKVEYLLWDETSLMEQLAKFGLVGRSNSILSFFLFSGPLISAGSKIAFTLKSMSPVRKMERNRHASEL